MRTRIILATFVLALTIGPLSLPAQEMPQVQIANWPAPSFWEPPARTDATSRTPGSIETESTLAASGNSPVPFIAVTPCRIVDTRLSGGAFAAGETRTYAMSGGTLPCVSGFPASLAAVSLNITVTETAGTGFVTGYPTGESLPLVVSLTWIGANQTVTNAAVVPIDSISINVYASQATHVILDVNGYYATSRAGRNVFLGELAGQSATGDLNTGIGAFAMLDNTTGGSNTAVGQQSLLANSSGASNVAIGDGAGFSSQTGSHNIFIGSSGRDRKDSRRTSPLYGRYSVNTEERLTVEQLRGARLIGGCGGLASGPCSRIDLSPPTNDCPHSHCNS